MSEPSRPDHVGMTAEEYMAAHPEVDWETHEVLYDVIEIDVENNILVTQIKSHWKKPDYEAIYAALAKMDEEEAHGQE